MTEKPERKKIKFEDLPPDFKILCTVRIMKEERTIENIYHKLEEHMSKTTFDKAVERMASRKGYSHFQ